MNAVIVLLLGFAVAIFGYRVYAKHIDSKIIKSDPKRATRPRCTWTESSSCPPARTSSSATVQIHRRGRPDHRADHRHPVGLAAGADLDPGRGALHRLGPGLLERHGGHAQRWSILRRIEPQTDLTKGKGYPAFLHLLLSAAHCRRLRNVVVSTATGLKAAPMAWLFMTIGESWPAR